MKLSGHSCIIASVLAVGTCPAQSAGVAVLKEQVYHRDVSGTAVAYSRIIDSRGPYLRLVSGRTNVDIHRSKMIARVEVADEISATITEEEDIAPIRAILGTLKEFTARYPQSEALLKPQITALTAHISHFDGGKVRFEGLWISHTELTGILKARELEFEASERVEVEKRVSDGYQRDNGLVLHDGKWMTPQDVENHPPESPTELSESIMPLWNGDLEGARSAVNFLGNLASKQTGAPKVRTERLISVVRNLFLAESRLDQRTLASIREGYDASIQDHNANAWLKPNGFGTVHHDVHRDSLEKAAEIRQRTADGLAQCKRELRDQLVETEIAASDFYKFRENRVAMILAAAVSAVSSRHFTESEFQPAPPLR